MANGDIGSKKDDLRFAAEDILTPQIVHVHGDIYAIACEVADSDGWIYTVKVDSEGIIPATVEASAEFEAETANGIFFIHITGNIFAVVTRIDWTELRLRTVSVSNDGKTITNIATRAVGAPNSNFFSMCQARGTIYAIAYSVAGTGHGIVKTFSIDDEGAISAELDDFEFDTTAGDYPWILNLSDGKCAIAYASATATKKVTTILIGSDGAISDISGGPLTITSTSVWSDLGFCRTVGNAFAVAWQDGNEDGWITSILIDSDGVMTDPGKADLEYDGVTAYDPYIIAIGLGLCALVYRGTGTDGYICTFEVDAAGNISEPTVHNLEFDEVQGEMPHIVHCTGDIYAIAYTGADADGWVYSLDIGTPPVGGPPKHLMMIGVG